MLNRQTLVRLEAYCDVLVRFYQTRQVKLSRAIMDEDRRRRLWTDCTMHQLDVHELQKALRNEIEAMEQ